MSGFFGIFNRNGKVVETKVINSMLDAISYWDPDDQSTWINGPIALGHTMLWNTPESKYEHLPLEQDVCVLTMDARIDNRDELLKELELPTRTLDEIGDSEFILAAYQKWGEDCPKYLLGDFAFAIWDKRKEQLFCARDHVGIKLFHFYVSDDLFVFSNDLMGILAHPGVPKDFDDAMVATYLKWEGAKSKRSTFFEKIKKLPPATSLTVSSRGFEEKKYWCIEDSPSVHYDSFEEYVEKLKELFENAVTARLRTDFSMASHMSGGIDSSPIAVFAARKLKQIEKKLYAFDWVDIPDDEDKYEYEAWNFSRRIASLEDNIIHEEFFIDPAFIAKQYSEHNILTKGNMWWFWEEIYIQDALSGVGCRTLLSGWGGDELISYNGHAYICGLVKQWKIVQALKYFMKEKKYNTFSWDKLIRCIKQEILPKWIQSYVRKIKKIIKIQSEDPFWHKYSTKEFADFMDTQSGQTYTNVAEVKKDQLAHYNNGHLVERIESWGSMSFSHRFEYRYPLLDKRIVEFSMGIPEELFYRIEGKERPLIKNAVSSLLPSDIVWFSKPNEVKINREMQKSYLESVKILQKESQNKEYEPNKNKYLKDEFMKDIFDTFDFEKSEVTELANIIMAIMFLNAKKNLNL